MKPKSLSVLLLLGVMGVMSSRADSTYMVEGIDMENITNSSRFYDTGKGYYWQFSDLSAQLQQAYEANNKSYDFLGDWASYPTYTPGDAFSNNQVLPLQNDSDTCWYQVTSNMITYWQTYYGVFYKGSSELSTGYTYDKKYLSNFGGTQSLQVAKLFYDNWSNDGGNVYYGANWYFSGTMPDRYATVDSSAPCGYFSDYFADGQAVASVTFGGSGSGSLSAKNISMANITDSFRSAFGFDDDGKADVGTIAYLGVQSQIGGHALTCYGYTTDDSGLINSLWITNSDDRKYGLTQLYTLLDGSDLRLYTDKDCTKFWSYASATDWVVNALSVIDTPDSLISMYEQYTDASRNQVWNGSQSEWSAAYDQQDGMEDLPDATTGWSVYVEEDSHSGYYSTWYQETRGVEFDDSPAADSAITVNGAVKAGAMVLSANTYNYSFSGAAGDSLSVTSLEKTGAAKATLALPNVTVSGAVSVSGGTLAFTSGTQLSASSVAVQSRGILSLGGGSVLSAATTNIGARSTLEIADGGASMSTALTLADGAIMSFILGSDNTSTAALSLTGSLTLGGNVSFIFNESELTNEQRYALISFSTGWSDAETGIANISLGSGSLIYESNTLYYTYLAPTVSSWDKSGILDSTYNGHDITFNANGNGTIAVAVEGSVSPGALIVSDGQSVTFSPNGTNAKSNGKNSKSTASDVTAEIKGTRRVEIGQNASLSTALSLSGRPIYLREGAALTYTTTGSNTISEIDMAAGSSLALSGASETTHTIQAAASLNGTITVAADNHLTFHLDEDKEIAGSISTVSTSVLSFRNASSGQDIEYSLASGTSSIAGNISIGHDADSRGTTLAISSSASNSFSLAANGTLLLNGGTADSPLALSGKVEGSGTVKVGETANVSIGNTCLATSTNLHVCGMASLGSSSATVSGAICHDIHVDGGELTIHTNAPYLTTWPGEEYISIEKLTLSGNATALINYVMPSSYYDSGVESVKIDTLHVGKDGGSLGAGYLSEYCSSLDISPVHTISTLTGSGDITFYKQIQLYEIHTSITQIGDISSFSGNICVESLSNQATAEGYLYLNALELRQAGNIGGVVTVNGQSDDESPYYSYGKINETYYAYNDPYHRAMLGLRADVSIGGLEGNEDAYLYSGELQRQAVRSATTYTDVQYSVIDGWPCYNTEANREEEAKNVAGGITSASHTLTLNNSSDHEFKGTVLSGISLVKQGSGSQTFSGDVSRFNGSVSVKEGLLAFASDISVQNLALTSGAELQVGGAIAVSGNVRINAASLSALYKVSSLGVEEVATFDSSAVLDGDLNLSAATSLSMAAAIDLSGHELTLNSQAISLDLEIDGIGESLPALTLMTGVGSIANLEGSSWLASDYFTADFITSNTMLVYENQSLILTGIQTIPEPTTATLSLLALAALAARRRRR